MADTPPIYKTRVKQDDDEDDGIDDREAAGNRKIDNEHRKYSGGKKWGDVLTKEEQDEKFEKKPDKEINGRTFENSDPRKEWGIVPSDALQKYDKKHYDEGGKYPHWDPKDKSYWRLKRAEKPVS